MKNRKALPESAPDLTEPIILNLFMTREGHWDAILTKKDVIYCDDGVTKRPYHTKHVITIHPYKVWKAGTYVGPLGSVGISNLNKYMGGFGYTNLVWDWQHKDDKDLYKAFTTEKLAIAVEDELVLKSDEMDNGAFLFTRDIR